MLFPAITTLVLAAAVGANPVPRGPLAGTPGLEHEVCADCSGMDHDGPFFESPFNKCVNNHCCAIGMECELKCINDHYAICADRVEGCHHWRQPWELPCNIEHAIY